MAQVFIWAQGADLIINGTVNPGAEVIADGNLHVYGNLRGRAIAGGADNTEARVFALNFDPELVSIAISFCQVPASNIKLQDKWLREHDMTSTSRN